MQNSLLILMPFLSAFIGWIMFRTTVKMLFHPKEPIHILGLRIQGLLPGRKREIGEKLGKLAATQLMGSIDIEKKIADPAIIGKMLPLVEEHIDKFLHDRLPKSFPMLSMFIGEKTIRTMKGAIMEELELLFPEILRKYAGTMVQDLALEDMIREKVDEQSTDKLEILLRQELKKEFRNLEILGGIMGFLIGLIQVLITVLIR